MMRLLSTIRWDIQLQVRNGFYHATAFVAIIWIVILTQVHNALVALLLPAFILQGLVINSYWFISGLVLLEKGEGTLEAQIVTPLRSWEYLVSKVASLTLLSMVENLVIALAALGIRFHLLPLLLGIITASVIFIFTGFVTVSRYDSLSDYILPGAFFTSVFSLPLLFYFGLWEHPVFYLHPLQAPLLLMNAAFSPIQPWEWVYSLLYSTIWIIAVFFTSQRAFYRFVIAKQGVKA